MDPTLLNVILTVLSLLGVGISIFGFPGMFFIVLAALIYVIQYGFVDISVQAFVILSAVMIFSFFVDNLAAVIGAKRYGASKYGMVGAFTGGILGIFIAGPFGILPGAFLGAVLAEIFANPNTSQAFQAGIGTFIGYLIGLFLKFLISLAAFVWLMFVIWG